MQNTDNTTKSALMKYLISWPFFLLLTNHYQSWAHSRKHLFILSWKKADNSCIFIYPVLQITLTLERPCDQHSLKETVLWQFKSWFHALISTPKKLPHGGNPSDTRLTPGRRNHIFVKTKKWYRQEDKDISYLRKKFFSFLVFKKKL